MGGDDRSPEVRGALTRRKICLVARHLGGICPGTRRLEEICHDTMHLEGIYRGSHRPEKARYRYDGRRGRGMQVMSSHKISIRGAGSPKDEELAIWKQSDAHHQVLDQQ